MEFYIVYVASERLAVGLSGPMADLGGLSRLPSPIADWPCNSFFPLCSVRPFPTYEHLRHGPSKKEKETGGHLLRFRGD